VNSALLLITTLLVTTLPVLAQDKPATSTEHGSVRTVDPPKIDESTPKESWNIFANDIRPESEPRVGHLVSSDTQLVADSLCYTIRSYVVARDSKHSDAVHPAGYSTCQPASKYRLRTTQMTSGSLDR
jgi:hypothetical protein